MRRLCPETAEDILVATLTDVDALCIFPSTTLDVRDTDDHHDRRTERGRDHGTCCTPLGAPSLTDDQAEATARVFKALADPHRVKILNLLATGPEPVCVCEFTEPLCLSQPTVSHHLKKLVQAGLLDREQRGTWAYYRLRPDALGGLAAALDLQGATR
jgi:ArsR family transcriptional regulator, arsenate/arsenite/antimonite-responsive transcriptional repressor